MRLINQPLRISSKKETRRYKISIRLHPSDLFLQFNKKLYFAVAYYKAAVPFSFGYPFLFRYNIVLILLAIELYSLQIINLNQR